MGFKKLNPAYAEGGVEINRAKTDFDMAKNLNSGNLLTYKDCLKGRTGGTRFRAFVRLTFRFQHVL